MTHQPNGWPADADGDVFRRMQASGFDFGKEVDIEFMVDLESWPPPMPFLQALRERHPDIKLYEPDEDGDGYVKFIVHGLLTYELVTAVQAEVSQLAAPYGGVCEAWGAMQPPAAAKSWTSFANGQWLGASFQYEGFPLALRVRPSADAADNRARFTQLVRLTHQLAQVSANGLPEPDYNRSLVHFDKDAIELFEPAREGVTALVETFGGKRIYYGFASASAPLERRLNELRQRYPEHDISIEASDDPEWRFLSNYRKDFPW